MDGYSMWKSEKLYIRKKKAIQAAKDLRYDKSVIDKIENAKSIGQIETIMVSARKRKFKDG